MNLDNILAKLGLVRLSKHQELQRHAAGADDMVDALTTKESDAGALIIDGHGTRVHGGLFDGRKLIVTRRAFGTAIDSCVFNGGGAEGLWQIGKKEQQQ